MKSTLSGMVRVNLGFLDKVGAIIPTENLPIIFNNHPQQLLGLCKVMRDDTGKCIGELTFDKEVDGNLFFYYNSLNTEDGTFWFSGVNLAEELFDNKPTLRLNEKII